MNRGLTSFSNFFSGDCSDLTYFEYFGTNCDLSLFSQTVEDVNTCVPHTTPTSYSTDTSDLSDLLDDGVLLGVVGNAIGAYASEKLTCSVGTTIPVKSSSIVTE